MSSKVRHLRLPFAVWGQIFRKHGLPQSLRTNNATSLTNDELTNFLLSRGIQHKKTTPLWPQANGEVECQNKSIMRRIRIAITEGQNWKEALADYIFAYRITSHSTTGIPPAEALFGTKIRSKITKFYWRTLMTKR